MKVTDMLPAVAEILTSVSFLRHCVTIIVSVFVVVFVVFYF